MRFLKITILGGVLFLIPVIVLVVLLGKAVELMLAVAEPLAKYVPIDSIADVAIGNILAVIFLMLLCFIAGLIARTRPAQKLAGRIESGVLDKIPGYTLIKGMATNLSEEHTASLRSVLVTQDGVERLGLEVERVADERVAVLFPDVPNPWSGSVEIIAAAHVKLLDASVKDIFKIAEQLGRGTGRVLM